MDRYLAYSRSAYYGVLGAFPLLVAYELLILATTTGPVEIRNAADVWLRTLLAAFGLTPGQAFLAMILLLLLAIPIVRDRQVAIVPRYFGFMLAEGFAYSLALGFVINLLLRPLLTPVMASSAEVLWGATAWVPSALAAGGPLIPLALPGEAGWAQIVGQSIGAGLFEEFMFRVILLNLLLWGARVIFSEWLSAVVAILGASFLFSLAHYVGPLGDPPDVFSFLYRWVAGMLFTVLYYVRGFTVTAYAHALYDIRILLLA